MALSIYDQTFLDKEQQQKVQNLTKELEKNPARLPEIHQAVEDIRSTAGYSGGVEGNQYIKLNNPNEGVPELPDFAGFRENAPEVPDLQNNFEWDGGSYQSELENMLSQVKSQVDKGFTYDSANDEAFQAFRNQMLRMGNRSYQNDMAAASARTGGTISSYGQAVASQSRNQYLQQATDAIPTFRNQALNEYKMELDSKMQMVNQYNTLNEQEYAKYQDEINLAVNQYEMELNNYLTDIELAEKAYDYEMQQYQVGLENTRQEIQDAWDRTQTLGYVSNQDANILGLEPGTLSEDARKAEQELELYLDKQEEDLKMYKKELQAKMEAERQQANWELKNLPQGGSGGAGGGSPSDEALENAFDLSENERKDIRAFEQDYYDEMNDLIDMGTIEVIEEGEIEPVEKDEWESLSEQEQIKVVNDELDARVGYLVSDLEMALSSGNDKLTVVTMRKLKTIYDSKWFINYADDTLKAAKQVFMNQYNSMLGQTETEEIPEVGSNGVPVDLMNPGNTRSGTK